MICMEATIQYGIYTIMKIQIVWYHDISITVSTVKLTGTKLGCSEGGCGACTVMVSQYNRIQDEVLHYSVNACLIPLCSVNRTAITTVEGIGSTKTVLHPCQERIARAHGSQCGFCTPGFVMSMYTLLRNNPKPSENEIEGAFHGELVSTLNAQAECHLVTNGLNCIHASMKIMTL